MIEPALIQIVARFPAGYDALGGNQLFAVAKTKHGNLPAGSRLIPTGPFERSDRAVDSFKSIALVLIHEFQRCQIEANAGFGRQMHSESLFAPCAFDLDGMRALDDVLIRDQRMPIDEEARTLSLRQITAPIGFQMLSGLVHDVHPHDTGRRLVLCILPVNTVRLAPQEQKQQYTPTQQLHDQKPRFFTRLSRLHGGRSFAAKIQSYASIGPDLLIQPVCRFALTQTWHQKRF
jgi:hypothetical protein